MALGLNDDVVDIISPGVGGNRIAWRGDEHDFPGRGIDHEQILIGSSNDRIGNALIIVQSEFFKVFDNS